MTKPIGNRRPPKPKERQRVGGNVKREQKPCTMKDIKEGKQTTFKLE